MLERIVVLVKTVDNKSSFPEINKKWKINKEHSRFYALLCYTIVWYWLCSVCLLCILELKLILLKKYFLELYRGGKRLLLCSWLKYMTFNALFLEPVRFKWCHFRSYTRAAQMNDKKLAESLHTERPDINRAIHTIYKLFWMNISGLMETFINKNATHFFAYTLNAYSCV